MSDITDRIAKVLRDHGFRCGGSLGDGTVVPSSCWGPGCEWEGRYSEHPDHVATVLVETLGLTPEYALRVEHPNGGWMQITDARDIDQARRVFAHGDSKLVDISRHVTSWERADA